MSIEKHLRIIAALCLSTMCLPAVAALEYGHMHPNLVLDTETGLIWMPVASSASDLATYSAFGRDQRLAGRNEVFDLFERELGLPFGGSGQISADAFNTIQTFSNFVAGSLQGQDFGLCPTPDCTAVSAAYSDGSPLPLPVPRDVMAYELGIYFFWEDNGIFFGGSTTTLGGWTIASCGTDPGGFGCDGASAWLVMSAVPLPAAAWFLLSGCLTLIGLRKNIQIRGPTFRPFRP